MCVSHFYAFALEEKIYYEKLKNSHRYISRNIAAAAISLPRCYVEKFGLHGQSLAPVHEIIQFLPPLEDGLNGVVEDDLGFIKICL